jgi:hypothetical protein
MAVRVPSEAVFANFTWLPLRETSEKSGTDLDLDGPDLGSRRRLRRFEVEREGLLEVCQCFFLATALAGDVDFQALGDHPAVLAPEACIEFLVHGSDSRKSGNRDGDQDIRSKTKAQSG